MAALMAAFVKMDCGLLDSSLWIDREAREIFITALLMAEPVELVDPVAQLHVRALKETGFVVPPGWYGIVRAAGSGIVARALVDREAGLAALERLGSPDQDSRSAHYSGRRLVRFDGGYLVLNFQRYRDRDYGAAERMRRLRARRRAEGGDDESHGVTRNSRNVPPNVTQAEAEAYEEKSSSDKNPKNSPPLTRTRAPKVPPFHGEVIGLYHELLPDLPAVKVWSDPRRKSLEARIQEQIRRGKPADRLDYWREFFEHVAQSDFLCGRNGRDFRADLEWLIKPTNFVRVIEGRYANSRAHNGR